MSEVVGEIIPKGALVLRTHAGDVRGNDDELLYELTMNTMSGTPCIRSERTKKMFTLSWEDILGLAKAAGIDEEWPEEDGGVETDEHTGGRVGGPEEGVPTET